MTDADNNKDKGDSSPISHQSGGQDKTRIHQEPAQADKTRVNQQPTPPVDKPASSAQQPSQAPRDVTRFQPATKQPAPQEGNRHHVNDKTQFRAPTSQRPPSSEKSQPTSAKKILKGRFELESILGTGGMGVVYKAKDRLKVEAQDRDPYVAIKVLSEEFKTHPEAFIALQRESRKAQRIAHPSTVKVYDFDRDGDIVFMTMEYMVGKPLDQMIRQYHATGLPRDDAWAILADICSALAHAHHEKIVHSDFKPGNVFITDSGMAKIFDFGIARAVAKIDRHADIPQDQTVFDAGGLGALTPAYASLEMLQGKTPDVRDDIYALGCVTYEIFTGEHPFDRIPADEAHKKKLKPKRITDISKQQWKAIEASLAFKRENRMASVDEFYHQLTAKKKPKFLYAALLLASIGGAFFAYTQFINTTLPTAAPTVDLNEFEFKIRYQLSQEKIESLLIKPSFSSEWEGNIWSELRALNEMQKGVPDEWYISIRDKIYQLYVQKISQMMHAGKHSHTKTLIGNGYRYTDDPTQLDNEAIKLTSAIQLKAKNKNAREMARQRLAEKQRQSNIKQTTLSTEKKRDAGLFNVALTNVNRQLQCIAKLNMRDFNIAITKLRTLDHTRYTKLESEFTTNLARCISAIGKKNPEHALDAKRYALRIFQNNPAIMAVAIKERDACDLSIAGLGSNGDRAACRDKLANGGEGPMLVVIPGSGRLKPFAIGKYEISYADIAAFCKKTEQCEINKSGNQNYPVTTFDISTVKRYLKWLSKNTQRTYRLPTKREWVYAAKSSHYQLDPNRNCHLSTRGITKGGELVRTTIGKQNSWGMVNYAGNVQEWVYRTGKKLVAVGGSHNTSMDQCTATATVEHSGKADKQTGFRVARELVDI
ncbi:MAG: protein kinase [Thiotrichaceae bacterium]|nr:protein kinase [Thiotrichaceae bacterium]